MLAFLLAAVCFSPPAQYHGIAVRPLNPHTFIAAPFSSAAYTFDGNFDFVGTSEALYKTMSIASNDFNPLLSGGVNFLTQRNDGLYVLTQGSDTTGAHATVHTVLRSTDSGVTLTPIDAGLEECIASTCHFLAATQIDFAPGRIFLGAGGNLLVSADNGATWKLLYGTPENGHPATQTCPMRFGRIDQQVIIAGECPLDQAFVSVGTLRSDMLDWQTAPQRITLPGDIPPLENRNAQFVAHVGSETYIGLEGALLKSCDDGATYHYVIHFPVSGGTRYPYVRQFLAPAKYENVRIVGGFDKATLGPFLAWSGDRGETWIDATAMLPADSSVALLTERRDGLPMIFIERGNSISMQQIVISAPPLRHRAVGK